MKLALVVVLLLVAAAMLWVRLAPSDPQRWHVDPAAQNSSQIGEGVVEEDFGARSVRRFEGAEPEEVLRRLDDIATATPRTHRIAGSPEEGRITWITRSAFFGFPDYTTAEVHAEGPSTMLTVYARLRFGKADFGVNAARLRRWLSQLSI